MSSTERVRRFRERHGLSRPNLLGSLTLPGASQVLGSRRRAAAAKPAAAQPPAPAAPPTTDAAVA